MKLPSIWSNSPPSLFIVTVATAKCDLQTLSYIFANPWNFRAQYVYYLLTFSCTWMQSQCIMKERDHYSGTFNATIHIVCGGGGADLSSFTPFTPSWSLGGIMTIASQNSQLSIALHFTLSTKKQQWQSVWPIFGLHEATETFWDAMELLPKTVQMLFLPRKLPKIANILFIILWAIELFWRWSILGCDMHLSFLKSTFRLEIVSWVAENSNVQHWL